MLARLFVFFGGLLVIVLCSLLLAPLFVDWAGYRSAFEREASRITGQTVRVEGTAKARILPFPSVTFSNVVIEGADGIEAARIAAFSMDAELAPFLSGEILIFDMRIERPDVRLKLAEDGALLWALPNGDAFDGKTVALENVTISEGRMTVEREGREPVLLAGINGKVSAQSLSGPWLADGRFMLGTTTYDARLSTSAKQPNETLRMRLNLAPQGGFYDAAFDGRIAFENDAPNYAGKLDMTVLGTDLADGSKRQKIADIRGAFSTNSDGIKISDAALSAGPKDAPYRADGFASIAFGKDARFDVTLKGQQISLGEIEAGNKTDRVALGMPLGERLLALQNILAQIPVPDIPGRVDLALPALVMGDTIIRNAEIRASPAKTGWQIERYSVELPGRTIIEGNGDLALDEALSFSGQMVIASKQPTGFANWLGLKANDAIRALPGAGFSARVDVNANRQTFRDVEFRAGAAVLRGLIDRKMAEGARSQLSIRLAGENANLDILSGLAGFADSQNATLFAQDIDIALTSAPVSGFGFQAEKLDGAVRLADGTLAFDQLDITGMAGADIALSGSLSFNVSNPQGAVDVTVSAIDPMPLIEVLGSRFPNQGWLKILGERAAYTGTALADGKLTAKMSLDGKAATVDYSFDGAGLRFGGKASSADLAAQNVAITAKGDADNGETVLAALGVPVSDTVTALQLLEPTAFELSLTAKAGEIENGTLKAVSNNDIFETGFGLGAHLFNLVLSDAAPYAMTAGYGLPGAAFGLPISLKGSWEKAGEQLNVQKIEGSLVDVPFTGNLSFTHIKADNRLKLNGSISAKSFDRSVIDEIVFGPFGAGSGSAQKFVGNISLPFDADIVLAVDEATGFAPLPLTNASTRMITNKEAVRLTELKANIAGGIMSGAADLRKNGVEALINFNASVVGADLSKLFASSVAGKSNLQIEVSATGSDFEALQSSMIGSGVLSAADIVLQGISTGGFKSLVDEADRAETAPDTIATLELAIRNIMTGQIAVKEAQTAFTIAAGIARAPRNLVRIEGGALAVEPKLDLNNGEAELAVQVLFDTGEDAVAGTEPALNFNLKGPWNELSLAIDTQPLQGFLSQRALEREQKRVEAIQSAVLEKQRLRRENRYYAFLMEARAKAEAERLAEIERLALEAAKQEQLKLEAEAVRLKAFEDQKIIAPLDAPATGVPPAKSPTDIPLNLDGLLKELDTAPQVQP